MDPSGASEARESETTASDARTMAERARHSWRMVTRTAEVQPPARASTRTRKTRQSSDNADAIESSATANERGGGVAARRAKRTPENN